MSVKVYSTSSCPWCTVAKNYLSSKNIRFEDLDVNRDREAAMEMVRKSGQRGVPVLDINGDIIVGFDQAAIDNALKKQ
ncbi:MAG: NrdH-redoxin [Ruminiclostridium sp.]|nr:NrdH-redoxin [Ruminiclostridium sp.]